MARLLKIDLTSRFDFIGIARRVGKEAEASRAGIAKAEKKVEGQKGLVHIDQKSANNAHNDVAFLRAHVAAACTSEEKFLSTASAASSQTERATAELRHACDTISIESRELRKSAVEHVC